MKGSEISIFDFCFLFSTYASQLYLLTQNFIGNRKKKLEEYKKNVKQMLE